MTLSVSESLVSAGMTRAEAQQKTRFFEALEGHLPSVRGAECMRWFVPGRIEVLGKHTDYAGGRSLLCTAERGFCVAAIPRSDSVVRINDVIRRKSVEFTISPDLTFPDSGWTVYPSTVARRVACNFPGNLRGADIALASDLPRAAGTSSSSALVVAIFSVLSAVNRLSEHSAYAANVRHTEDLAGYLGCIENGQTYQSLLGDSGVGTFGGSEDHTAILGSQPGYLKQYAFCPVRWERTLAVPADCTFVIAVSGVVADKIGSARSQYNRASEAVKAILEISRSVSGSDHRTLAAAVTGTGDCPDRLRSALREAASAGPDSQWLLNRFEQFWLESEVIIPKASHALARQDLSTFGELVKESQTAAEALLGNQVPETIWLAGEARSLGAYAASAFGAGFGGSVWALVAKNGAGRFANRWREAYERSFPQPARDSQFFASAAGPPLVRLEQP
jgi:galactokinase